MFINIQNNNNTIQSLTNQSHSKYNKKNLPFKLSFIKKINNKLQINKNRLIFHKIIDKLLMIKNHIMNQNMKNKNISFSQQQDKMAKNTVLICYLKRKQKIRLKRFLR